MKDLIINGIDFNKRLESARHSLYLNIDWRAQLEGLGPFFNVVPIQPERDETMETFREMIQRILDRPMNPMDIGDTPEARQATIEAYKKALEKYLAVAPPQIRFELIRIK